jgi:hypothetical protein
LTGDPSVAAFLTLGRLFQDDDFGSKIVRSDGGGDTGRPEPDDDIRLHVPFMRH